MWTDWIFPLKVKDTDWAKNINKSAVHFLGGSYLKQKFKGIKQRSWKWRDGQRYHANIMKKKIGMAKLIADKEECKTKGTLRGLLCNNIKHICRINISKTMHTKQCRRKDILIKIL